MGLNCFNSKLGTSQGRIPSGEDFVFVLGDEQPGEFHDIKIGDYAEVVQETDLTGVNLLRVSGNMQIPESTPSDFKWVVSIVIDDLPYVRLTSLSGHSRNITDMAANVSKLSGIHRVGVRLTLST